MSLRSFFGSLLEHGLDLVAPRECAGCGAPAGSGYCGTCRRALTPVGAADLDGVPLLAAGRYAPPLDRALRRYKYESRPDLAKPLARLLTPSLRVLSDTRQLVWVPVPLHPRRLAERGYDQACLLSRILARATHGSWAPRALTRVLQTDQQARLPRSQRESNVRGAFSVPNARSVHGRRVVLVDDVVTTGATARACLDALSRAGARIDAVACVALAGAQRPEPPLSALRD